ncbi:hypothetical protein Pfo_009391 [Paulownia fortunei]|nr:hypothetical protein Pfo_009391 [Paulownia fortunei]
MGYSSVNCFWRNGQWNDSKLDQLLPQHMTRMICDIPISETAKDEMKWKLSANGDFSIASAWELIRSSKIERQIFRDLWCNQFTPTMSIFFWRLINNWIPADTRLQEKGFNLASKCHCCSSSIESTPHLFITGDQARVVWDHFALLFKIRHPQTENPILLLQYWKLSTPFSHSIHIFIRKIYDHLFYLFKYRKIYRKLWRGDMEIARTFDFNFPMEKIKKAQQVLWKKPQVGWFKLNSNGAAKGETGQAGAGGVIRDHRGNVAVAYFEFIGNQNSIHAEIFALMKGLELTKGLGIANLWIEMDAKTIINLVSSNTAKGNWRLQEMLSKSKFIMSQMHIRITHIYREENTIADFLANEACSTRTSKVFSPSQLTGPITGLLRVDQMGIPSFRLR